jgi:hypothetical protein
MARNPGTLVSFEGGKGIIYNKEQKPEFEKLKKRLVHFINEDFTPLIDTDTGKQKTALKSIELLKPFGKVD